MLLVMFAIRSILAVLHGTKRQVEILQVYVGLGLLVFS